MNFDELQKQWDNQSPDKIKIESNFEFHTRTNTIIDKVRETLKKDFFFQLTTFPILFSFPYFFGLNNPLIWWIAICYSMTFIIPLVYIFRFYRKSYKLEYSSLKNINWFYYNYKSSIEVYSIYTLIVCILMVMFIGIIFIQKNTFSYFENDLLSYIYVVSTLVIYVAFCVLGLKWWIKKLYIKPLNQIKEILDDLEENI